MTEKTLEQRISDLESECADIRAARDAAWDRIEELEAQVKIDDRLLEDRGRLLDVIPACPSHGSGCIPHAIAWVNDAKDRLSLRSEAESRQTLQSKGRHPAPCARYCEAPAFESEIRTLKRDLRRIRVALHDAICRPMGVVPASAEMFYSSEMADQAESQRMVEDQAASTRNSDDTP